MLGCAMLPFRREKLVRYFANDRLHDASSLSQFELQDPPPAVLYLSLWPPIRADASIVRTHSAGSQKSAQAASQHRDHLGKFNICSAV
jgi:hypothetical protein